MFCRLPGWNTQLCRPCPDCASKKRQRQKSVHRIPTLIMCYDDVKECRQCLQVVCRLAYRRFPRQIFYICAYIKFMFTCLLMFMFHAKKVFLCGDFCQEVVRVGDEGFGGLSSIDNLFRNSVCWSFSTVSCFVSENKQWLFVQRRWMHYFHVSKNLFKHVNKLTRQKKDSPNFSWKQIVWTTRVTWM